MYALKPKRVCQSSISKNNIGISIKKYSDPTFLETKIVGPLQISTFFVCVIWWLYQKFRVQEWVPWILGSFWSKRVRTDNQTSFCHCSHV